MRNVPPDPSGWDERDVPELQLDTSEAVNHPPYYGGEDNPYEAIKVIEAWGVGFALGNTIKYISRAPYKRSELEDLEKAAWYLDRRIQQLKAEQGD